MTNTDKLRAVHQGRNVKRFRELWDMKQDTLAEILGEGWSQKKISMVESSEVIDPLLIDELAKALKTSPEAIKNLNDDAMINIISNTINNHDQSSVINYFPKFDLGNKWLEALDENKRLNDENKKLYEALLKEKDEKIALLQQLLDKK